jgi:hypothetical protein
MWLLKKLILNGIISAVNLMNIYAMLVIPMPPMVRNYFPQLSMLTAGLVILTTGMGNGFQWPPPNSRLQHCLGSD